jgi:predicted enzyme related to lactoylglutathione lyase
MSEDQPVSGRRRLVRPLTERKLGSGAEREGVVDALRACVQGVVRPESHGALEGPNSGAPSSGKRLEPSVRRTIMSKMNPVVHFEMPYDDRERMAKFYQEAFGWQTRMLGDEMGNYVLATTTETDGSRPKEPGAINGGFFPKRPDWPAQHPSVVIAVDDIQSAMKKVADAGGKVLGKPMEIPGVGQYVAFVDTEGNRVSMLQPLPCD